MIQIICKKCGNQFFVKPSRIVKGAKFCSKKCKTSFRLPPKKCLYCQRDADKRGMCDRHYLRWYRYGDPHFRKKRAHGEGTITTQGYRATGKGYKVILEHRAIMEIKLGRKLSSKELIHHIDGNKLNNSIDNLELINRSIHPHRHPENILAWQKLGNPARWKKGTI